MNPNPKRLSALFLFLLVFVFVPGCGILSAEEVRPNIVFIMIDTLRKDHMGCYGYGRETTPFIDSLAKGGLIFENAVSQAPWTLPSVCSIFTSKYPSQHGALAEEDTSGIHDIAKLLISSLPDSSLTIAEILRDNGYRTHFITANRVISAKFNANQGFSGGVTANARTTAGKIVDFAIRFLSDMQKVDAGVKEHDDGFFLYLHFMDLHSPTKPPAPYDTIFPTLDSAPHDKRHYYWKYFNDGTDTSSNEFKVFKSHKLALYDGALRYLDDQVRRLDSYLKENGLSENTVFVIVADHGEEMWDHAAMEKELYVIPRDVAGVGHGHTMFHELLDIPLIFYGKGVPEGLVKKQVRAIDIAPSLLGLAGIAADGLGFEGEDAIDLFRRGKLEDMPAFSENIAYGYEKKSIQDGRYKYIWDKDNPLLFDRVADPLETADISKEQPEVVASLDKKLSSFMASLDTRNKAETAKIDKETIEELRTLGYVQ